MVVAHYTRGGEGVPPPWLAPVLRTLHQQDIATCVYLYLKGRPVTLLNHTDAFVERLRNVGREGHTYLHHMANTDHHPPSDVTVDLQDHLGPHRFGLTEVQLVQALVLQALKHGVSTNVRNTDSTPPGQQDRWAATYGFYQGEMNETLGAWFDRCLARHLGWTFPRNKTALFYQGACFAVRTPLHLPGAVVDVALVALATAPRPMVGYLLERLWFVMFLSVRDSLPVNVRRASGWLDDGLDAFGLDQRRQLRGSRAERVLLWGQGRVYCEWEGCESRFGALSGPITNICEQLPVAGSDGARSAR